jgi:hypothetical protein
MEAEFSLPRKRCSVDDRTYLGGVTPDLPQRDRFVSGTSVCKLLMPLVATVSILQDAIQALPDQLPGGKVGVPHLLSVYEHRLKHVEKHVHDNALSQFTHGFLQALRQSEATSVELLSWRDSSDELLFTLLTDVDHTRLLMWDVFLWRQPHEKPALLVAWGDQQGQLGYVDR